MQSCWIKLFSKFCEYVVIYAIYVNLKLLINNDLQVLYVFQTFVSISKTPTKLHLRVYELKTCIVYTVTD